MRAAGSGIRLMMTTDAVGGVWIYATTLARSLGLAGFEVLLVTLGPQPTGAQRATLRGCPGVSLIETDLQLEWLDPAGSDLGRADAVLKHIADGFRPDLVHLNSFREAMFDWDVPTVVVAHSCVNSWADACGERGAFNGDEWKAYSRSVQGGLKNADVWVAPSRAFREQLRALYGLDQGGQVIWNGVESRRDKSSSKRPLVLSAGRLWDKAKNVSVVASVASGLEWPVSIAGRSAKYLMPTYLPSWRALPFSSARRCMSHSGSPCSKLQAKDARCCFRTFPRSASYGMAQHCFLIRAIGTS
jgi:hypothetical protein